jgi:error-prone DNA polymerase
MPPTATGVCFVTLEDEAGFTNLIVWNNIFNQYRKQILETSFLMATGKVQRSAHGKVVNILVESAEALLGQLPAASHDFY